MERTKTGIRGLDEMLGGGIPKDRSIVICGGPGTGKTSFCMEFLYRGAMEGEKGLFLTLEENAAHLLQDAFEVFSKLKRLDELIKSKTINVVQVKTISSIDLLNIIKKEVSTRGVKRLVIDSSTILKIGYKTSGDFRRSLYSLLDYLSTLDCTTLLTIELPTLERGNYGFEVEDFVVDGIIALYDLPIKNRRISALEVLKMRSVKFDKKVVPFAIEPDGIKVFQTENILI
jgi:KaiC/GvpD/RAD55 family RecA-like ATPase